MYVFCLIENSRVVDDIKYYDGKKKKHTQGNWFSEEQF